MPGKRPQWPDRIAGATVSAVLTVALACSLAGCQSNGNEDLVTDRGTNTEQGVNTDLGASAYQGVSDLPLVTNQGSSFSVDEHAVKSLSALQQGNLADLFSAPQTYTYPEQYDFVPGFLSDTNVLYGVANTSGTSADTSLAAYDLNTGGFTVVAPMSKQSEYGSIIVTAANADYVIYEETDQQQGTSRYYLLNLKTKARNEMLSLTSVPAIHYTQAVLTDDGVMMNYYDADGERYVNGFYSFAQQTMLPVETNNCGFPVLLDEVWYYIVIDNANQVTKLVRLDLAQQTKDVVLSVEGDGAYMNGLFRSGSRLILSVMKDGVSYYYTVKGSSCSPLFHAEWIESVVASNRYATWLGGSMLEDRVRPEYFVYDFTDEVLYQNDGGPVFVNDNGIAWVRYKHEDSAIEKGKLYTNDNSMLEFQAVR